MLRAGSLQQRTLTPRRRPTTARWGHPWYVLMRARFVARRSRARPEMAPSHRNDGFRQPGRHRMAQYEDQIYDRLKERAGGNVEVQFDQLLPGRFSGVDRQIDVVVRGKFASLPHDMFVVVDCKCWSNAVDVADVDCMIGLVKDVDATLGLIVTTVGAGLAAEKRGGKSVEVEVVPFDDLGEWLERRPSVAITHGASHGSLTYSVGHEMVTELVEREFAERVLRRITIQDERRNHSRHAGRPNEEPRRRSRPRRRARG
jgi:hypothetical protein